MCLQDLRIAKGVRLRSYTAVVPASGIVVMPDHRTAYMIYGFPSSGQFNLVWVESPTQIWLLPADFSLGFTTQAGQVFTPQSFGGVPPGQLAYFGAAGATVNYIVAEYDAGVDEAVTDSIRSRGM